MSLNLKLPDVRAGCYPSDQAAHTSGGAQSRSLALGLRAKVSTSTWDFPPRACIGFGV